MIAMTHGVIYLGIFGQLLVIFQLISWTLGGPFVVCLPQTICDNIPSMSVNFFVPARFAMHGMHCPSTLFSNREIQVFSKSNIGQDRYFDTAGFLNSTKSTYSSTCPLTFALPINYMKGTFRFRLCKIS